MDHMIDKLQLLGLRRSEAYVYLKLVELSWAYPGELSRETQINRVTVYDILERLVKKGLVTFITQGKKRIYQPVPPQQLLDQIIEKERVAREIIPDLQKSYEQKVLPEEVKTLKGREGVRTILRHVLSQPRFYLYDSQAQLVKHMAYDYDAFERRRVQKGVIENVFVCKCAKTLFSKNKQRTITTIPESCSAPITKIVSGDTTAIITWNETIVTIVLKSNTVADSFQTELDCLQSLIAHADSSI